MFDIFSIPWDVISDSIADAIIESIFSSNAICVGSTAPFIFTIDNILSLYCSAMFLFCMSKLLI